MSALLALLKQKQQDMSASRRSRTEKIQKGASRWRIMPSWRGEGQQFWHDFGQHFIKDSTGKIQAIYMCTDKTFGKPCAVCDAVGHGIKGASDDASMAVLMDAKAGSRVLVNAIQVVGEVSTHKMDILELPPTVFEMFVAICAEWEEAGESVLGLSGKDIIITRNGEGKNTKYTVLPAAKASQVNAEVCSKLHDLDQYVAQESSEAQNRALNSVRSLSGLLPAPSGMSVAGRASTMLLPDDDPYATAAAPPRKLAPPAPAFEDVPDLVEERAAKPVAAVLAPKPAAKPAPAAADSTGDAELDDLLASLD